MKLILLLLRLRTMQITFLNLYEEVVQVKHDCIHILQAVPVGHVIDYSQIYYNINYTCHHTRFLAVSLTMELSNSNVL